MDDNTGFADLLGRVFDNAQQGLRREVGAAEYKRRRADFVFHMTDWKRDLKELWDLSRRPEKYDVETATIRIMSCLYHVIPHLKTAGRLLVDEVSDPFENDWKPQEPKPTVPVRTPKHRRTATR